MNPIFAPNLAALLPSSKGGSTVKTCPHCGKALGKTWPDWLTILMFIFIPIISLIVLLFTISVITDWMISDKYTLYEVVRMKVLYWIDKLKTLW